MLGLFKGDGSIHKVIIKILLYDSFDYYDGDVARYYIKVHYLDTDSSKAVWVDEKTLYSIGGFLIREIK